MEVKSIEKDIGTIHFLVDDKYMPIKPVYDFIYHLVLTGKSINTTKTYAHHLKLYYEWLKIAGLDYHSAVGVGQNKKAIILENFQKFIQWLQYPDYNEKLIPIGGLVAKRQANTVNQIMNAVLSFYDFLVFSEGIERLAVYKETRTNSQFHSFLSEMYKGKHTVKSSIFKQKEEKKALVYVTRHQYEQIYQAANNQRDRIIIGLLFEAGLRVSEVIGLHIADLKSLGNNKITITKRFDPNNPDAAVKYDSIGDVFIPAYLSQEINDYLLNTLVDIDTDYLIINLYNEKYKYRPIKRDTIEDMIQRMGKKVGIKNLHPHAFRHGIAVDMLAKGCDMLQIKDHLRHKNISTTSAIYAESDIATRRKHMENYYKKIDDTMMPDGLTLDVLIDFLREDDKED